MAALLFPPHPRTLTSLENLSAVGEAIGSNTPSHSFQEHHFAFIKPPGLCAPNSAWDPVEYGIGKTLAFPELPVWGRKWFLNKSRWQVL